MLFKSVLIKILCFGILLISGFGIPMYFMNSFNNLYNISYDYLKCVTQRYQYLLSQNILILKGIDEQQETLAQSSQKYTFFDYYNNSLAYEDQIQQLQKTHQNDFQTLFSNLDVLNSDQFCIFLKDHFIDETLNSCTLL
jgi:hypothetical protein